MDWVEGWVEQCRICAQNESAGVIPQQKEDVALRRTAVRGPPGRRRTACRRHPL